MQTTAAAATTNTRKRCRLEDETENAVRAKRHETTIACVCDELLCPIALELPLDPVTAEDGRTYERSEIEKWIKQKGATLRSPITNEPMGPRLMPAIQVRNAIERLVRSGEVASDMAGRWNQWLEEQAFVSALKRDAELGDTDAMCTLGSFYAKEGIGGHAKDLSQAIKWFRMAAESGNIGGMAAAGSYLIEENMAEGMALLKTASARGSSLAAYCFGLWYSVGRYGLPQNKERAKFWFRRVLIESQSTPELADFCSDMAMERLEQLEGKDVIVL